MYEKLFFTDLTCLELDPQSGPPRLNAMIGRRHSGIDPRTTHPSALSSEPVL